VQDVLFQDGNVFEGVRRGLREEDGFEYLALEFELVPVDELPLLVVPVLVSL